MLILQLTKKMSGGNNDILRYPEIIENNPKKVENYNAK